MELSQARALEVVDNILDLSLLDDDESFGKKVYSFEKPRVVSAAKGSRDMAFLLSTLLWEDVGFMNGMMHVMVVELNFP